MPGRRRAIGWWSPNFDGWRAAVFVVAGRVVVQGRSGRDLTRYFGDVAAASAGSLPAGTVIDGELVAFNGIRTDFEALGRRVIGRAGDQLPAHLVVFDLLQHPDRGVVTHLPLHARRELLVDLLADAHPTLSICPQADTWAAADEWLTDWSSAGVAEGVVLKLRAGRYRLGGTGWLKRRARHHVDLVLGGFTGTWQRPRTLLLGAWYGERLRYVGTTTPLTDAQAGDVVALLAYNRAGLSTEHGWPNPMPGRWINLTGTDPLVYHAVASTVVIEVMADTATDPRGAYRHPLRFVRIRPDVA